MIKGKHIILGITGGIAAYKSVSLLRLFVKAGAEVQVVITPAGKEFITPVTLSALSGKPVISDFFTANTGSWNSHVDLGLWADAMVIAPATASSIGKMANGIADNMLITTYLSSKCPVFVAPAMDLDMYKHPSTTANLEKLRSYGNILIEPAEGELASHLVGKGRMEEPENIFKVVDAYFAEAETFKGKKVLVTAGPTYEKIDPVRFIGNYSSGKMGYAIVDEFARRGADVTIVSGPVSVKPKCDVDIVAVESAVEMHDAVMQRLDAMDVAVMCAAVADYRPETVADKKIKREKNAVPEIKLVKNPDIAAAVGQKKRADQLLVGFALETDHAEENALDKLARKNLDMIVLNSLEDKQSGFGIDTNKVTIVDRDGTMLRLPVKTKLDVAKDIVDKVSEKLNLPKNV